MLLFPLPASVQTVLRVLSQNGFVGVLVGGCVRDACMGQAPHDFDMATDATPAQIHACFEQYRTLDTGEAHGTVTVLIDHEPIELTTFRIDGGYQDHRHPTQVSFTTRLGDDLARRDFTINAMAYDGARLIDPFGGQDDLIARIVRCVGDADTRFNEDALRILRAMRFASVLGFSVQRDTADAMHRHKALLRVISVERIWAELRRMLPGENAPAVLLEFADVLREFLPASHDDCIRQLSFSPCDTIIRLAILLQNTDAAAALLALRADKKTITAVTDLLSVRPQPVRRMLSAYGEAAVRAYPAFALATGTLSEEDAAALHREIDDVLRTAPCLQVRDLAVNGNDLQSIGLHGTQIGRTLRALLDGVLDGALSNEKDALLQRAASLQKQ